MPNENFSSDLLEILPEIIDTDDIFAHTTIDKIKQVVKFDCAKFYLLSPNELCEIYPENLSISISEQLSKALFEEKYTTADELNKKNHLITYLKIKGIVFGIAVFEKEKFSENERKFLNALTKIVSYKIKDKELSEVFKTQIKTLSNAIDKSKNAEKIKTDFIANVSHELRTPLNAIIGFSELLQNKKVGLLNPKQTEYVNDIQIASLNLLGMINEILDMSKLENASIQLVKQNIHIKDIVKEATEILHPLFIEKKIKLISNINDFEINGDFQKLKQVIFNILSNAIKFTKTEIAIFTTCNDNNVEIHIKDDGIGISKKNHKKIFKKFAQIQDYSIKKENSTGLGLTISQEFIKMHNGTITVNSDLNKGAEFIITLPLN